MSSQQPPLKPIEAFRIVAWKACAFAVRRWKLGPLYYCATCVLPYKNLPEGCPKCELTKLFNLVYKEQAKREIALRGGMPEGFTLEGMMATHARVAAILADNDDKINPLWPVAFTELVRVVLQERAQMKYNQDWEDWKKMSAKK